MRSFYIFKINKKILKYLKNNPKELYMVLKNVYFGDDDDFSLGYVFLKQLIEEIDVKELDIDIFKNYKNNYFYMKYKNTHSMHDVYRNENTTLTLHKTYLKLDSDVLKPRFLNDLKKYDNLFVCDFFDFDYFWLDSLLNEAVFI